MIRALLGWAPRGPCKPPTTPTRKEEVEEKRWRTGCLKHLCGTYAWERIGSSIILSLPRVSPFRPGRNNQPARPRPTLLRVHRVIIKYLSRLGIAFHRVDAPPDLPYCVHDPITLITQRSNCNFNPSPGIFPSPPPREISNTRRGSGDEQSRTSGLRVVGTRMNYSWMHEILGYSIVDSSKWIIQRGCCSIFFSS